MSALPQGSWCLCHCQCLCHVESHSSINDVLSVSDRPGIRRNVRKGGLSRTMASERVCPPTSYALEALSLGGLLTSGSWSSSNFFLHWRRLERGDFGVGRNKRDANVEVSGT